MRTLILFFALLAAIPHLLTAQLQLLNDEFDSALSILDWQRVNDVEGWNADQLEAYNINLNQSSAMRMMPYTSGWFQDRRSTLAFKEVSGDFVMTTRVRVTDRAGTGWPNTSSNYSLAGMLFRTPRHFPNGPDGPGGWTPGGENYIFLSLGHGDTNGPCNPSTTMNLEVKTTVNSNTTLCLSDVSSNDVTIRIARIDAAIIIMYHLPNQPWVVHQRYSRPDFPDTLQAGLHCYTDWNKVNSYDVNFYNRNVINANLNPDPSNNPSLPFNPDIIAEFDYARFFEPVVPAILQGVDLVNQASDADLLSFLSDTLSVSTTDPFEFQFTASPNPVKDRLQLQWSPQFDAQCYRVMDLNGKAVLAGQLQDSGGEVLDVSGLEAGMYLMEVTFPEGIVHQKILRH